MSDPRSKFLEIASSDPRYPVEAYDFLSQALAHASKEMAKRVEGESVDAGSGELLEHRHVSGRELLEGVREHAINQFGRLAYIVFDCWNLKETDDIGNMVFRLVENGVWRASPDDKADDFHRVFDFYEQFVERYKFNLSD